MHMNPKIIPSVQGFFHNILDYAGLFPPASLQLQESFENYLEYMQSQESWMLSKFICPIRRVRELQSILPAINHPEKVRLSLLASPAVSTHEFLKIFENDISEFAALSEGFHNKCLFETVELKIPETLLMKDSKKEITEFVDAVSSIVKTDFDHSVFIFCEIPASTDMEKSMKQVIPAINIHNGSFSDAGFKLRTGGTVAVEIPPSRTVVAAIRECLDHKVTLKFTAGMHHPFRHYDDSVNAKMHGFINVFGAGILAFRHAITDHELREMIDDENIENFVFSDDSFEWKGWKSDTKEIHGARNGLVISFGSCSFTEPVDDLKELKLLLQ